MNEKYRTQFLGLSPHRVKFRVGKIFSADAAADCRPLEAILFNGLFELLNGKIRELQCKRRERSEPIRFQGA